MKLLRPNHKLISLTIMLLLAFSVVLSGCGQGSSKDAEQKPADTSATAAANTSDEEIRKVKHSMGEASIKGTPKRVVVLTQEGTEALLELGVKPVGAVNSGLGDDWFPHIRSEMEGITELGDESKPNVELILGLKPDLIIGNKIRDEEIYSQLEAIAPTVLSEELSGSWKTNFKLYAEALNLKAEGDAALAKYETHIQEAKSKIGDKLSYKVSLVRFLPQAVRLYKKDTFAGVILSDLGFARPAVQDKDEFMEVIGKERMADMDGDVMFYFNADYDEKKGGTKMQEEWFKDPLFNNLNVAKKNMAFHVDEVIWNLSGGIKSANLLIDDIVSKFQSL
ncbi:ABC transporter substrate-binding protein [Paenibacillus sp. SN-8-1]|uniref:ABC transporter substrate-binding protein n=1 Tax=Paenibacillus sp. SN-8-1 TaxID=3435409 RepID=UPI003D9A75AD